MSRFAPVVAILLVAAAGAVLLRLAGISPTLTNWAAGVGGVLATAVWFAVTGHLRVRDRRKRVKEQGLMKEYPPPPERNPIAGVPPSKTIPV